MATDSGSLPSPGAAKAHAVPRGATLAAAYAVLAFLLAVPVLVAEVPLGGDTLNHLARIDVRAHIAGDADLARLFELRDDIMPDVGLNWTVTPLAQVVPTLVAGRIGTVQIRWGKMGAAVVLQRVFTGRIGAGSLLMGLVSNSTPLASSFLNSLVGLIGALLGLAAWHLMRDRAWLPRLAIVASDAGCRAAQEMSVVDVLSTRTLRVLPARSRSATGGWRRCMYSPLWSISQYATWRSRA